MWDNDGGGVTRYLEIPLAFIDEETPTNSDRSFVQRIGISTIDGSARTRTHFEGYLVSAVGTSNPN